MASMDATEATTGGDSIVGCTDGFRQGYVEGWAWRPGKPHDMVVVQLLVDGKLVAESTACLPRPDLSTAGIGSGQHAFAIPFSIEPDSPPVLRLQVRVKDGPVLPPGEFEVETTADSRADLARKRSVAYLEQVFGPFATHRPPPPRPAPQATPPRLNFVLYTARPGTAIAATLGMPEYSYVFVMRGYRQILRRFGTVHVVHDPTVVDGIHDACLARGESCVMLSFAPPQSTPLGLRCPTIPVIAWEFSSIPEGWGGDAREDWRLVLRQTGRAITISQFATRALLSGMGADFPVLTIPTPVWDRLAQLRAALEKPDAPRAGGPVTLQLDGFAWDSRVAKLSLDMRAPPFPSPNKPDVAPAFSVRGARFSLANASFEAELKMRENQLREEAALQAAEQAQLAAAADRARRSARGRLRTTMKLGREWYRQVARDDVPLPVRRAFTAAGRVAWALRAAPLSPATPPLRITSDEPGVPAAESPATAQARDLPNQAAARAPSGRYQAAPDAEPLPMPELAVFAPDPRPALHREPENATTVQSEGVIFTAVLSPKDGRKNWQDILTAFIAAFRTTRDATLILKMIGADANYWWWEFHTIVKALPPFECRVLVLSGYLDDREYGKLIAATHFVVNASLAEGQCLPLVEFMSAGRPAIAPLHTAMLDYITPANAVIVSSAVEFCSWPHDPRNHLITTRHRVEWSSIRDCFAEAYRIARLDPERYAAMAVEAAASVRGYCADDVLGPKLAAFLGLGDEVVRRAGWHPRTAPPAEALP
jgi:hypothetical protein